MGSVPIRDVLQKCLLCGRRRRRGSDDISAQNLSTSLSAASSQTMPAVFLSLNTCNAAQSYKQTQANEYSTETVRKAGFSQSVNRSGEKSEGRGGEEKHTCWALPPKQYTLITFPVFSSSKNTLTQPKRPEVT